MYLANTSSEEQSRRRSKGQRAGANKVDYIGFENDNLKITAYSHYQKDYRHHVWTALCKECKLEFNVASYRVKTAKSCGCKMGKGSAYTRRKQALEEERKVSMDLIRRKWV